MSYSIIRVAKVKGKTNTTGIQKHVQRENKKYENLDVDLSKSEMNYDLINSESINFNQTIENKIEQNYNGKRKIRKDAVKHIDGIITSDDAFFRSKDDEEIKDFFKDAYSFLSKEYGEENLLYATVHMDEKTPHMHFGIVPLTDDGRLSAKEILGNKKALTELQDRFNQFVNEKGYKLERGTSKHKTERQHKDVEKYKKETNYHKQNANKALTMEVNYLKQYYDMKEKYKKLSKTYETVQKDKDEWEQERLPKLKNQYFNISNQNKEEQEKLKATKHDIEEAKNELERLNRIAENKKVDINDLEAFREQIRAEKDKEEENYQSLTKVLNEPLNDEIEYEYKKPSLFAKESEKTGRVILKEDDYKTLKKKADVGKRIEPEYKKLMKGETLQQLRDEINDKRQKMDIARKNFKKLTQEKDKYKSAYETEKQSHNDTKGFVRGICSLGKEVFGAKNYRKVINSIDNSIKDKYRQRFREIVVMDKEDEMMFARKDREVSMEKPLENIYFNNKNKDKDKGFDLDL
ncbi:TPA: MobV family relaxase [Staphylococcus aureus]